MDLFSDIIKKNIQDDDEKLTADIISSSQENNSFSILYDNVHSVNRHTGESSNNIKDINRGKIEDTQSSENSFSSRLSLLGCNSSSFPKLTSPISISKNSNDSDIINRKSPNRPTTSKSSILLSSSSRSRSKSIPKKNKKLIRKPPSHLEPFNNTHLNIGASTAAVEEQEISTNSSSMPSMSVFQSVKDKVSFVSDKFLSWNSGSSISMPTPTSALDNSVYTIYTITYALLLSLYI